MQTRRKHLLSVIYGRVGRGIITHEVLAYIDHVEIKYI